MAAQIPSVLTDILLAINARLVDTGTFPDEAVKMSLRMNPPAQLQAETYAIILPLTFTADEPTNEGGGRYNTVARGRVDIYPRIRCALDPAYEAKVWLTDQERGILPIDDKIYDALQEWFPIDDNGNALTAEGLKWLFTGEPHAKYATPELGDVVVEYKVAFSRRCTLPELT